MPTAAARRCRDRQRFALRGLGLLLLAAAGLTVRPALAQSPPPAPALAPPTDPLTRLQADVDRLSRELAAEREARLRTEAASARALDEARAAAAAAERHALSAARLADQAALAPRDGLAWRRGNLTVRLSGLLQVDAVAWNQASVDEISPATGEPLNQTRFLLRRGRLRADLEIPWLAAALELDANTLRGSTVRVLNGWVSLQLPGPSAFDPPYVAVTVGLLPTPFGYELRELDADRVFLERSNVVNALFPSPFDLGVVVHGGWRFLRYAVAAVNGNPVNDLIAATQFQARDPDQSKDLLGRLGVDFGLFRYLRLQAGASALWGTGFHAGTPGTKDMLVWRDADQNGIVSPSEIQAVGGRAGTPSQTFSRYAVGADVRLTAEVPRLGQLAIYGEVIWATNLDRGLVPSDPVDAGRSLRQFGGYIATTLELTRWVQVGLRYDRYNPDADAADQVGATVVPLDRTFSTLAVLASVRLQPHARLVAQYDHNDNALGRDAAGRPARLAADALTFRAQVRF
jgi:hypothetical protein